MSAEGIKQNLLEEMNALITIFTNDTHNFSVRQRSIILNSRLNAFRQALSQFYITKLFTSEQRTETLLIILETLNSRIYFSSEYKKLVDDYIWLSLCNARNYILNYLLELWGQAGELRLQGTANALVKILTGLEVYDVESLLVERDHPEFIKWRTLAVNYLSLTAGIYTSLLTSVYTIAIPDFISWTATGIKTLQKQLEIVHTRFLLEADYQTYQIKHSPIDNFHSTVCSFILSDIEMIRVLHHLLNVLGDKLPEELHHCTSFDLSSYEGILNAIYTHQTYFQRMDTDYQKLLATRFFNPNDNPQSLPVYDIARINIRIINLQVTGMALLYELYIKKTSQVMDSLKIHVIAILKFFDERACDLLSPNLFQSPRVDYFSEWFIDYLAIIGVYVLSSADGEALKATEAKLGLMLAPDNQKRNPKFYLLFLRIKIMLALKTPDKELLFQYAEQMIKISEQLVYQPRDLFANTLLGLLLKYALKKDSKEIFITNLKNAYSKVRGYISVTLSSEIEVYLDNIFRFLANEKNVISYDVNRLIRVNIFNPESLLIPDLSPLYPNQLDSIKYLPFNLGSDQISI